MTKFHNHVYIIICEVTLTLYKDTGFGSHFSYCKNMHMCMKDGKLSKKQMNHICKIADVLDLVFSMDNKTTSNYISDYFSLEKYQTFQSIVLQTNKCFPETRNKF